MMSASVQLKTILICALGGEGGGVLSEWITQCAARAGLPAQATSVPGVAQRTGATSYYIELLPEPAPEGLQPVFALVPAPGRVDVVVSSELLETARILERGFVSPARTTLISSSSRVYTTVEKMQMGDGRVDDERLHEACRSLAKTYHALDLEQMALESGTVISATMFGALAGAGAFPWPREVCEDTIKAGKRGAAASLKGFDAAFRAVRGEAVAAVASAPAALPVDLPADFANLPQNVREVASHGVARLIDYQDRAYADLYLDRLRTLTHAAGATGDARVAHSLEEAARRLALWMAYEDIPRVADLKTRKARFERIRADAEMQPGQILHVTEYLKPGGDEIADMLPVAWGERIVRRIEQGRYLPFVGRGVHLSTTSITGFLMLRLMAQMQSMRRKSLRFQREQQAIGKWLLAMQTALPRSPEFAGAMAELPRLLKGYGETYLRGRKNYAAVVEGIVQPALAAGAEAAETARLRRAIGAALSDPEAKDDASPLAKVLAEPAAQSTSLMAAQ